MAFYYLWLLNCLIFFLDFGNLQLLPLHRRLLKMGYYYFVFCFHMTTNAQKKIINQMYTLPKNKCSVFFFPERKESSNEIRIMLSNTESNIQLPLKYVLKEEKGKLSNGILCTFLISW